MSAQFDLSQIPRELLLRLPAQEPPLGVIPDLEHPSRTTEFVGVTILSVSIVVATFLLGIKLYTQFRILLKVELEDYLLFIAWAVYCGALAPLAYKIYHLPLGIHQWETNVGAFIYHIFYWYCIFIVYGVIIAFLNMVILLQICRIFVPPGTHRRMYWTIHLILWLNALFRIFFTLFMMLCCSPRAKFWDVTITQGRCLDHVTLNFSASIIDLVTDVVLLLLPQRAIFQLRLAKKKKIGLSLLFAFGILACVVSAVRTYFVHLLGHKSVDYTYILARVALFGQIQLNCGFIIATLPALPKFLSMLRKTRYGSRCETSLRSFFHKSISRRGQPSVKMVTIGGGNRNKDPRIGMVSDIEFHDLVLQTDLANKTITTGSITSLKEPTWAMLRDEITLSRNNWAYDSR